METVLLDGNYFSARFIGNLISEDREFGDIESGDYTRRVYFWKGEGEINTKGKKRRSHKFLFVTSWTTDRNDRCLKSLRLGLLDFYSSDDGKSCIEQRIDVDQRIVDGEKVTDFLCQHIIDLIRKTGKGKIVPDITLHYIDVRELVVEGAISEADGQIQMPLCK